MDTGTIILLLIFFITYPLYIFDNIRAIKGKKRSNKIFLIIMGFALILIIWDCFKKGII
ncbi:MAG: hypothetical protein Q4P11_05815 [Methanobrevibacter sp.]|nr:hypothetical protein [Methanobrevibacter sp.]